MTKRPQINSYAPKARKPQTKDELGYFLAGLIDSDGHIGYHYIGLSFNYSDISVAYYVKSIIGYGSVKKVKNKWAVSYICTHKLGQSIIADLVRNKLKHLDKISQYNSRLAPKLNCETTMYTDSDITQNHWLAGFIQGDGSLQIKQLKKVAAPAKVCNQKIFLETRVVMQIDQKTQPLLKLIQTAFGGYLGYRSVQDTFYYSSVNFGNAVKLIHYLDRFQLMGSQLTYYWLWRKTYLIVQNKLHNTEHGYKRIALNKEKLSCLRCSKLANQ